MSHIKFEIKETLGVVSESAKGWNKELNLSMTLEISTQRIRRWERV